jgi:hypothetical protein
MERTDCQGRVRYATTLRGVVKRYSMKIQHDFGQQIPRKTKPSQDRAFGTPLSTRACVPDNGMALLYKQGKAVS